MHTIHPYIHTSIHPYMHTYIHTYICIYIIIQILVGVQEAQQKLQSLEVFSAVEVLLDTAKGTAGLNMCVIWIAL